MTAQSRLRVLVVDDERLSRRLIVGNLSRDFEILEAEDGDEAIVQFQASQPDVVLLDVEVPHRNGVDTARVLKAMAGSRFVPIFLISGLEEQSTMIRGLAAGADDFLPKPFNIAVFKPKLDVFLRLQSMQRRLLEQNTVLEAFHHETQAEHRVAVQVFERVLKRGALTDSAVRVHLSPLSVFNGDAVVAGLTLEGNFRLLAADVSGHGLTGALGTLPLMTLFHASTERGDGLERCAQLLSDELKLILPPQLFCSAALIELDRHAGALAVINAGMPDVVIAGPSSQRCCPSRNVPLGVDRVWHPEVERVSVGPGDRIFVMSDGVTECHGADLGLFGTQRVSAALREPVGGFDRLLSELTSFAGQQSDDLSLVEVLV